MKKMSPTSAPSALLVLFRPELIEDGRDLTGQSGGPADARGGGALVDPERGQVAEVAFHEDAGHLLVALALVNRRPATQASVGAVRAAADRRQQIRPVLAYVDGHCRESITLDDVADLVHVSPSRVRHVFKDVTGVSFKEYLTQVRVTEAKRLLLGTDHSVAEVARAVSYTNIHQFYKVFYRSCAMSPGEYRRYYTPAGGEAAPAPAR